MTMQILSASNIRYLVALNVLDKGDGIRCIDIAEELGVTKQSVHRKIDVLCGKAIVKQAKYGMVYLTEEGRELAARYASYYDVICGYFYHKFALPFEGSGDAAIALLAGISDERMETMCEIMKSMF